MSLLISKTNADSKSKLISKIEESKNKPTRYFSKKQEDSVAKALNGQRNLNSGATMFIKGDCVTEQWLIECKTKTKESDSISIKRSWIDKNKQEALFMGKPYSALAINFGPDMPNYYIIDEYLFKELQDMLIKKDSD